MNVKEKSLQIFSQKVHASKLKTNVYKVHKIFMGKNPICKMLFADLQYTFWSLNQSKLMSSVDHNIHCVQSIVFHHIK